MPVSDAQKRASAKYIREKVNVFQVRFYPNDITEWEWLQKQPNKNEYIRSLIREDMERRASE